MSHMSPVMFEPGRDVLLTKPFPTGSIAPTMTTGVFAIVRLTAAIAGFHAAHQRRVARARHPARAAAAAQFAVCLRGRDLLDSGAVLLGDGIQAIRPVHRTDRIGPAIESAHARSRRPTRGGFSYRWCA